jgi:phosphatidylserine decarboxylase
MTIAREGLPIIFGVMFVSVVLLCVGYILTLYVPMIVGLLGILLTMANFYFFREPEFAVQWTDGQILSPADGKVIVVDDQVPGTLSGLSQRVSIFLSILDCHVNRIPTSGKIERVVFRPGKKLTAFKPRASEENQRSEIDLVTSHGRVHFRQIVGSVARRVVFDLTAGQEVSAGQRFGVMRFGSRMDLFFPPNVSIHVKVGEKVRGGKTVIGDFTG